jgi:hypothetical protein
MNGGQRKIWLILGVILGVAVLVLIANYFFVPGPEKEPEISGITEDFDNIVATLSSSEALVDFLNSYFEREKREGFVAYSPQEFYQKERGTAYDFAVFAAYVLRKNGFEAGVIRFNYRNNGEKRSHTVTVFRDTDLPKYITVTDGDVEIFHHGWSFNELIKAEEERLNVKISEYAYFPSGITDLTDPLEGYSWIEAQ